MNFRNRQLIDALAARYVLGMLSPRARLRFERARRRHASVEQAVRRWESRLVDIVAALVPLLAPAELRRRLRERLADKRPSDPH